MKIRGLMDVKFSAVIVASYNLYLNCSLRKNNGRARFAIMKVRRYDHNDDDGRLK